MERSISEAYIRRCHKRLMELGAPLEDWFCENVYDEEDAPFTCELCDCDKVRYVHVMRNLNYLGTISVGCICAGVMEGDILAAQEREREARNRAQRRKNFVSKGWTALANGVQVRSYHGTVCKIMVSKYNKQQYGVLYQGRWCWNYHQNPINSFAQAATAAFYAYEKEHANA